MGGPAPQAEPDALILGLIRSGNFRAALSACMRDHATAIGRLCMAMLGDQAEADDTVQETFVAAFRGFDSFRGEGFIKAWLCGIARRLCARRLLKRARRQQRLRLIHDAQTQPELPEVVLERRQRALQVRQALERIKPSDREALLLRYEAELSYREIGLACEIDEATARKRTSRALSRLRIEMMEKL